MASPDVHRYVVVPVDTLRDLAQLCPEGSDVAEALDALANGDTVIVADTGLEEVRLAERRAPSVVCPACGYTREAVPLGGLRCLECGGVVDEAALAQFKFDSGLCCMARHAQATPPWTCDCPCHTKDPQ